MRRDVRAFLWDMREAADLVGQFTADVDVHRYLDDELLRSAVERQMQNLGEALAQLAKTSPTLAARIPEHRRIIAFRNVLVHGYAELNHTRVWETTQSDLPALKAAVGALLTELDPPGTP